MRAIGPQGLDDNGNRAYSDSNEPQTLERTVTTAPAGTVLPPAGQTFEWTPDGRSLVMRDSTGRDTVIGPSAGGVTGSLEVDVTAARAGSPARGGVFTIADAALTVGQHIMINQAGDPISTKGTRADENEMDALSLRGTVSAAGVATVYWSSPSFVRGRFRVNYRSS